MKNYISDSQSLVLLRILAVSLFIIFAAVTAASIFWFDMDRGLDNLPRGGDLYCVFYSIPLSTYNCPNQFIEFLFNTFSPKANWIYLILPFFPRMPITYTLYFFVFWGFRVCLKKGCSSFKCAFKDLRKNAAN